MLGCDVKKSLRRESSSQSGKSFMSTLSPCTFCTARGLFTCNSMRMSFTMIPVWSNVSLASLLRTAITHNARIFCAPIAWPEVMLLTALHIISVRLPRTPINCECRQYKKYILFDSIPGNPMNDILKYEYTHTHTPNKTKLFQYKCNKINNHTIIWI